MILLPTADGVGLPPFLKDDRGYLPHLHIPRPPPLRRMDGDPLQQAGLLQVAQDEGGDFRLHAP
ncbi:MAG: hypothetical protein ACK4WK_11250, partial [Anaerolineae bacterium]